MADAQSKRVSIFNSRGQGAILSTKKDWDINDILEVSCERLYAPGSWKQYGLALRRNCARIFTIDEIRDDEDLLLFKLEDYISGALIPVKRAGGGFDVGEPELMSIPQQAISVPRTTIKTKATPPKEKVTTTSPTKRPRPAPINVESPTKKPKKISPTEELEEHLGSTIICVAAPKFLVDGIPMKISSLAGAMKNADLCSKLPTAAYDKYLALFRKEVERFGKQSFFRIVDGKKEKIALSDHGKQWFGLATNWKAYRKYLKTAVSEKRRLENNESKSTDETNNKKRKLATKEPTKTTKKQKNTEPEKKTPPPRKTSNFKTAAVVREAISTSPAKNALPAESTPTRSSRRSSTSKNENTAKPTTQKELIEAAKRKSVPASDLSRTVWLKGIPHTRGLGTSKYIIAQLTEVWNIPTNDIISVSKDPVSELWYAVLSKPQQATKLIGRTCELNKAFVQVEGIECFDTDEESHSL